VSNLRVIGELGEGGRGGIERVCGGHIGKIGVIPIPP
jgi:hypothetical protein